LTAITLICMQLFFIYSTLAAVFPSIFPCRRKTLALPPMLPLSRACYLPLALDFFLRHGLLITAFTYSYHSVFLDVSQFYSGSAHLSLPPFPALLLSLPEHQTLHTQDRSPPPPHEQDPFPFISRCPRFPKLPVPFNSPPQFFRDIPFWKNLEASAISSLHLVFPSYG